MAKQSSLVSPLPPRACHYGTPVTATSGAGCPRFASWLNSGPWAGPPLPLEILAHLHSIYYWRRTLRGFVASISILLKTQSYLLAVQRFNDNMPTAYHEPPNGQYVSQRHLHAIKEEYFIHLFEFQGLRDEYKRFASDFLRMLNDPRFTRHGPGDILPHILRAELVKASIDLDERITESRDLLRLAHVGVMAFYGWTNHVKRRRRSRGGLYSPLLPVDEWASVTAGVWMAELAGLDPELENGGWSQKKHGIQRENDWRMQVWMDEWLNIPEELREGWYGFRGSGWWKSNENGAGPMADRHRESEVGWAAEHVPSWGTRVLNSVKSSKGTFKRIKFNEGNVVDIAQEPMFESTYEALVPGVREAEQSGNFTIVCHNTIDGYCQQTATASANKPFSELTQSAEERIRRANGIGEQEDIRSESPNSPPRSLWQVLVKRHDCETEEEFFDNLGPLIEPTVDPITIDGGFNSDDIEKNPKLALEYLTELGHQNWRWHNTAGNGDLEPPRTQWGRRMSRDLTQAVEILRRTSIRFALDDADSSDDGKPKSRPVHQLSREQESGML